MTKIIYLQNGTPEQGQSFSQLAKLLNSQKSSEFTLPHASTLGEIHSRHLKVIDDGVPSSDDFRVVKPIINFSGKEARQLLLIYVHELSKLPSSEIVGFDFSTIPEQHIPLIFFDRGDGAQFEPTAHTAPLKGAIVGLLFEFKLPTLPPGPPVRFDFHFLVSAKKADGSPTVFKIDPQVGNDPPGP